MCDYSLMHLKSRPAVVGERLVTRGFGTGTRGLAAPDDLTTAVCLLPGTEIAFEEPVLLVGDHRGATRPMTAIFRQVNKHQPHLHHDALEFPSGNMVLLTFVSEGQFARVLQLPAAPRNKKEAEEQRRGRVEVVG